MNTDTTSPLQAAQLDATPVLDRAGNHLTRWTLTLCDWMATMGRLDTDTLNAL